ncbi:hypothetical protein MTR_1g090870 [Medicago truncatula]|uniref:Uncharacterized protein n=1 Tax=Medicago truncatula TaxID=3880 RepID=A0A072VZA6_MEDTR|nr:hypothetical protein MTR_1g090870 [Medicago truncatula]
MFKKIKAFAKSEKIKNRVVVGTPQQNNLAERMKITILESVLDECFKELGCPRFLGEKL